MVNRMERELEYVVVGGPVDCELTDENIDQNCETLREVLMRNKKRGNDAVSGAILVGTDMNCAGDLAATLTSFMRTAMSVRGGVGEKEEVFLKEAQGLLEEGILIELLCVKKPQGEK